MAKFALAVRRPGTAVARRPPSPVVARLRAQLAAVPGKMKKAAARAKENAVGGMRANVGLGIAAAAGGVAGAVDAGVRMMDGGATMSKIVRGALGVGLVEAGAFLVGGDVGAGMVIGGATMAGTVTYDLAREAMTGEDDDDA